jgi:hypothetical protein
MKKKKKEKSIVEDHKDVLTMQEKIIKKAEAIKKAKSVQRYYSMKYPLIDDIIKQHVKKTFEIKMDKEVVRQKFIEKPDHKNFSFWQRLKYAWNVLWGRAYVVYYFEDVQKKHTKYTPAYIEYNEV